MKPLRVLAFIEAATITGPAKNLLQFASYAKAAGHEYPSVEVMIATFVRPNSADVFLQAARDLGLHVFPIAENGPFDRSVLQKMRALVEHVHPDVVQSHAVKSHFLVRMTRLHHIAPWVAFHHGYTWPALRARIYNQLDRWSLRAASQVVTVSLLFKEELVRMGVRPDRIEVIHNAIEPSRTLDVSDAYSLRERWRIAKTDRVILVVGRLSKEKDHLTLLQAVKVIVSEHPRLPVRLIVVGDGPERPRLVSAVAEMGLRELVIFTGQERSVEPYYGLADVAVLSSVSEGSPNALLEAMAARVPAVATRVGGVPEIAIHDESALLVPPRRADLMASAIVRLLLDEDLAKRLTDGAWETVVQRHSPVSRARRLTAIYDSLSKLGDRR